jgi:4-amino-4-deoxy-L-arabinose transferase-like glycosyltransferase
MIQRILQRLDQWAERRSADPWIGVKLLILALALHLGFVCLHRQINLISDMLGYHESGMSLLLTGELKVKGRLSAARPPLYPIFIYLLYYIFGAGNLFVVRLVQALLGALTVILTFKLGEKVFSRKVGFWAALFLTLYPSMWGYSDMILSETLFTFLFIAGLYFLVDVPSGRYSQAVFAGILLAMATLTRTVLFQFPIFLVVVCLLFHRRRWSSLPKLAVFLISFWAVLLPWLARNERVFGEPILTTKAGVDFFVYNHNPFAYIVKNISLEDESVLGEVKTWALTEVERDHFARGIAMNWIKSHPLLFLFKGVRMWWNFFGVEREFVWTLFAGMWGRTPGWQSGLLLLLMAPAVYLLVPLFIWGIVYAWKKFPLQTNLRWMIFYYLAVAFVYYGFARHRMPLNPILMLFAGYALTQWQPILDALKVRGWWRRGAPAIALAMLGFVMIGWLLEFALDFGSVLHLGFTDPTWQQVN